jgi:proline iminopeptidase
MKIFRLVGLLFLVMEVGLTQGHEIKSVEGFIDLPQGKVWYRKFFTQAVEHDVPLIVLHGGPGCTHDYLQRLSVLANKMPVILYDQGDCGRSVSDVANKDFWTLERFTRELEGIVNYFKVGKVHLMGHSWGAAPVISYAAKFPERVASIVLASPLLNTGQWLADAGRLLKKMPEQLQQVIAKHEQEKTFEAEEYQAAVAIFYEQFLCRISKPDEMQKAFQLLNVKMYQEMWGPSEFTVTGSLRNLDCLPDLALINSPILFTCGRFDEATPETVMAAAKKVARGECVVFEQSAHFAMLEEPEAYQVVLRGFFERVAG